MSIVDVAVLMVSGGMPLGLKQPIIYPVVANIREYIADTMEIAFA